jgi:CRP-like cAMP-binding protein
MLSLREIPFLKRMGWEDINYLEKIAEMREYYRDEVFVKKGQMINRVYIVVQG